MDRSALLLTLLLAPAVAGAQTVTFSEPGPFGPAECSAGTLALSVTWTVTPTAIIEANSTYRIFTLRAAADACSMASPAPEQLIKEDIPAGTHVGTAINVKTPAATYPGFGNTGLDTLTLGDLVTTSGASCTDLSNKTITACVQLLKADGTYHVHASGTLKLELARPAAPKNVTAAAGDHALVVRWDAGTGSDTAAATYRAEAFLCADAADTTCGSTAVASATSGARQVRLEGLTVGSRYKVLVYAISSSNVESAASPAAFGVPIDIFSFWELYKDAGGQEEGGCAAGAGGLLSLLAVAGLLRATRRRP